MRISEEEERLNDQTSVIRKPP